MEIKASVKEILDINVDTHVFDAGSIFSGDHVIGAVLLNCGSAQALLNFGNIIYRAVLYNREAKRYDYVLSPSENGYLGDWDGKEDLVEFLKRNERSFRESWQIHTVWLKKPDGVEVTMI